MEMPPNASQWLWVLIAEDMADKTRAKEVCVFYL
jgi:hypothetical protein